MAESAFLVEVLARSRMLRRAAEGAFAQVSEEVWSCALGPQQNSIALLVKHVSGNMRSRWTDFLTTDGEKSDRDRDGEFEAREGESAAALRARWDAGWALYLGVLEGLSEEDLGRVVTIRGEPHTVLQAVLRQVTHYAYHVGQIVHMARYFAGDRWRSLSIPRGKSREFEVNRDGTIRKA